MIAHTLMRHPPKIIKKMNGWLQNKAVLIRQAEHRRRIWEAEAEKLPPKRPRNRD